MELDIYAGKRILYKKNNSNWNIGTIAAGTAHVAENGLFIPIIPITQNDNEQVNVEVNDIFLDAVPLDEWTKQYKEYFMTKDEYIQLIEAEDFEKNLEEAYVSDGEYIYYPVSKYNKTWITKQPFDYIVRGNI